MRLYDLIIKEEAKFEIIEAYNWYESKQEGLGERFVLDLDDYFERIRSTPEIFPRRYREYRQVVMKSFPFVIVFEIEEKEVVVYAVFNTYQDPNKLQKYIE
jgi:plasmid stabilization system protein ParE